MSEPMLAAASKKRLSQRKMKLLILNFIPSCVSIENHCTMEKVQRLKEIP